MDKARRPALDSQNPRKKARCGGMPLQMGPGLPAQSEECAWQALD